MQRSLPRPRPRCLNSRYARDRQTDLLRHRTQCCGLAALSGIGARAGRSIAALHDDGCRKSLGARSDDAHAHPFRSNRGAGTERSDAACPQNDVDWLRGVGSNHTQCFDFWQHGHRHADHIEFRFVWTRRTREFPAWKVFSRHLHAGLSGCAFRARRRCLSPTHNTIHCRRPTRCGSSARCLGTRLVGGRRPVRRRPAQSAIGAATEVSACAYAAPLNRGVRVKPALSEVPETFARAPAVPWRKLRGWGIA